MSSIPNTEDLDGNRGRGRGRGRGGNRGCGWRDDRGGDRGDDRGDGFRGRGRGDNRGCSWRGDRGGDRGDDRGDGFRGRGRGGNRGCGWRDGRGGDRGRGGNFRPCVLPNSTRVLCLGNEHGSLTAYDGHFDDARLEEYARFQIVPTCGQDDAHMALGDQLLEPQYAELFTKASMPNVRWKAQFGTQIVYFGRDNGLLRDDASQYEEQVLPEETLTTLVDGRSRSSFATHELSDCASVVAHLQERTGAQLARHEHILRFTEKVKGSPDIYYDHPVVSREDLLRNREFTVKSFRTETRNGNFVFVLPITGKEKSGEDYLLFRVGVVEPKDFTGSDRPVRVDVDGGTVSVHFVGDTAKPNYTRIQERYVLRVTDSPMEIHVMDNNDAGPTVTERGAKVRVELHCAPQQPSPDDWRTFIEFAVVLARMLPQLE